ncbi:MAG: hypothetical protein ACI4OJ_12440 [Lachnospiraceae bacterium]
MAISVEEILYGPFPSPARSSLHFWTASTDSERSLIFVASEVSVRSVRANVVERGTLGVDVIPIPEVFPSVMSAYAFLASPRCASERLPCEESQEKNAADVLTGVAAKTGMLMTTDRPMPARTADILFIKNSPPIFSIISRENHVVQEKNNMSVSFFLSMSFISVKIRANGGVGSRLCGSLFDFSA